MTNSQEAAPGTASLVSDDQLAERLKRLAAKIHEVQIEAGEIPVPPPAAAEIVPVSMEGAMTVLAKARSASLRSAWQIVTGEKWPEPDPAPHRIEEIALPNGVMLAVIESVVWGFHTGRLHNTSRIGHVQADGKEVDGGTWRRYFRSVPWRVLTQSKPVTCGRCDSGITDWRQLFPGYLKEKNA